MSANVDWRGELIKVIDAQLESWRLDPRDIDRDRTMLLFPDAWPGDTLPLVHLHVPKRLAILLDESRQAGWRVFVGNVVDVTATYVETDVQEILTYPNVEAVLAEWKVD